MRDATPDPRPNTRTAYEVIASGPNGEKVILGFTPRVSKAGLVAMMQSRGDELLALTNPSDDDEIVFAFNRNFGALRVAPRAELCRGEWCVRFTGRTELEVHWELQRAKEAN